jgi:hypothetical protein
MVCIRSVIHKDHWKHSGAWSPSEKELVWRCLSVEGSLLEVGSHLAYLDVTVTTTKSKAFEGLAQAPSTLLNLISCAIEGCRQVFWFPHLRNLVFTTVRCCQLLQFQELQKGCVLSRLIVINLAVFVILGNWIKERKGPENSRVILLVSCVESLKRFVSVSPEDHFQLHCFLQNWSF